MEPYHSPGSMRTVDWAERWEWFSKQAPHIIERPWAEALTSNLELIGQILQQVLRHGLAEPGRDGPKPLVGHERGFVPLRQILGEDYSDLPFAEAYKIVVGDVGEREVSRRTGIERSRLKRAINGAYPPGAYELKCIAEAFGRHPSFFREYRIMATISFLAEMLDRDDDLSRAAYEVVASSRRRLSRRNDRNRII